MLLRRLPATTTAIVARSLRRASSSNVKHVQVGIAVTVMPWPSSAYAVLIKRGTAPAAGSWSLPGGRMAWGETVAQAAEREVAEECGIACRVLDSACPAFTATDAIYLSEGFHYVVVHVLAATSDPAPTLLYQAQHAKNGGGGIAAPTGPLHVLPALQAGDDAADVAWVAIDSYVGTGSTGKAAGEASNEDKTPLLPAKGGTRVVRLSELMASESVIPLVPSVLHKARASMEAHLGLLHHSREDE